MRQSKNMMINMWERVSLYCMNHEVPHLMKIVENTEKISSPFYGCTQYFPELKFADDETPCANRLNLDDYEGIVFKFMDIVASHSPATDFTNYTFDYKGGRHKTTVKCLKYTDSDIRLGVINTTVLGVRK